MTPSPTMRQWLLEAAQDTRATPEEREVLTRAAEGKARSVDEYRTAIGLVMQPDGIYGRTAK